MCTEYNVYSVLGHWGWLRNKCGRKLKKGNRGGDHYLYSIDHCPSSRGASPLASKCHEAGRGATYHTDMQVQADDGTLYANLFCALCNGIALVNVSPVSGQISCNNLDLIQSCGLGVEDQILRPSNYVPGTLG